MKRIKTFAARGLLVCGLASYATPALAATNACSHANTKEVGTHMDHWSARADDGCSVSWTVDRVATLCLDCQTAIRIKDIQLGTHSPCGNVERNEITIK